MLIDLIEGKEVKKKGSRILPTQLVIRDSTRKQN